jgi:cytochrome c biogenesis protein CcmG/thiol:disulfide interchange protein DsbE
MMPARMLLAVLVAALHGAAAAGPADQAPPFELPGIAGKVSLESYRGKVVYLDFWASWCGPCLRSFPWMNGLQKNYGGAGLQVLAINLDAQRADADAFLARVPAQFPVGFDPAGASGRAYGIKGMPSSMLIGRDGRVLWRHTGFNEADKGALESRIRLAVQAGADGELR